MAKAGPSSRISFSETSALSPLLKEIVAHCDIGYAKGVRQAMATLKESDLTDPETINHLNKLVDNHQYAELAKLIKQGLQ